MKWLPNYGKLMKPLFQAVKMKPFQWTNLCDSMFNHIKELICSAPILRHYDDKLPLFLITDASLYAYGCVLARKIQDTFHAVMFHGKCFSQSEYKYSIFEKELKALYNSVKALSAFLKGKQFTVLVDNKGVSFLKTLSLKDHLSHRWGKWLSYLSEFEFYIEAIKSNANPADAISRMPCRSDVCPVCKSDPVFLNVPFKFNRPDRIKLVPTDSVACQTRGRACANNSQPPSIMHRDSLSSKPLPQVAILTQTDAKKLSSFSNQKELAKLQDEDPDLKQIKDRISKNMSVPPKSDIQNFSQESRKLFVLWDKLSVKEDVLQLTTKSQMCTVTLPIIPKAKYIDLCDYVHDELLHPGYDKLYNYIRQNFIAFGIASIVKHFTGSCEMCQKKKLYTYSTMPEMTSLQATFQGATLACDHFGPLPPSAGYTHILAITDVFSRYVILVAQKCIDSNSTASAILHHVVKFFWDTSQNTFGQWQMLCLVCMAKSLGPIRRRHNKIHALLPTWQRAHRSVQQNYQTCTDYLHEIICKNMGSLSTSHNDGPQRYYQFRDHL